MDRIALKRHHLQQRKKRVRKKINGNATVPRISVYRSNRHFYLQAIDDTTGVTMSSVGTYGAAGMGDAKSKKEVAQQVGSQMANHLQKKKITRAVYDCNGNRYHGIVKAIADSIRAAGVQI